MSGTKGLFARGLNNDGTEGLFARGFLVAAAPPAPSNYTAEIRPTAEAGAEFDVYETAGIGSQFTITKEQV